MALDFKNLHLLVVEDIAPMRDLTVEMLKALGVGRISKACDGQAGYKAYEYEKPDIIITDWEMPNVDGIEFVQKIRRGRSSLNRTIPIIMMSGFCAHERVDSCRNAGVTEFLVKPFSAHDIASRIIYVAKHPRDFIVGQDFVGPDRRRKEENEYEGPVRRVKKTHQRIQPNDLLAKKIGVGTLSSVVVERSQKVIDQNKIDFIPIAESFLCQLSEAIKHAEEAGFSKKALDNIISPVMQVKANASIFKYVLIGDLANVMLGFLENLNGLDQDAIEIITAHHTTLAHLVSRGMKGDGGDIGTALKDELEGACARYKKIRAQNAKEELEKTIKT